MSPRLHRFVQIGDLHLGPNARNVDRIAAIDQILDEQLGTGVAAYLWPGDLNDGRMTIEDKNVLVRRVRRILDDGPLVVCYGNHDLPGDLDFLSELKGAWPCYVVARPIVLSVPLATEATAAIFVCAYPTRAGLVATGTASSSVVDVARDMLDAIFLHAAAELARAAAQGAIPLMIGHFNVKGAIASTGQPQIGQEIEVDHAILNRLGPIYKGLNHIHKAQTIGDAYYAGSCCRLDWGECDPKQYLVVEYFRDELTGSGWRYLVNEMPIDVAPMYHVEGTLTRDGFDWTIARGPHDAVVEPQPSFAGAEVRVRFRFNPEEKAALNFDLVKAPFAGATRLETDPIAMRTRAARAPDVAAAATLEEKVATFVVQSGLPWDDALLAKLAALQQADGAAFLTAVQREIAAVPELEATV